MKAMIMAAGVGSRLMPMTRDIPKPMVPMGNRPLMENIVKLLKEHGIREIIANLHYHPGCVTDFFGNGTSLGMQMNYSREKELLGTAGGVKRCQWFLDDTFVIVSGDALTDIDLTKLIFEHKKNGALATIALKEVDEVEQFGVVITDETGMINDFQEKPARETAKSNQANTGIYIFEPEIFNYIPENTFYDFGKQVFPNLVKIKAPFYGINISDYWCDVGSLQTYFTAHCDLLEGKLRSELHDSVENTSPGGKLLRGENVQIGSNVILSGNVIIGPGCRIHDNVRISDSVIWDNVTIEDNVIINRSIIGNKCRIYSGVKLDTGSVIPAKSEIVYDSKSKAI